MFSPKNTPSHKFPHPKHRFPTLVAFFFAAIFTTTFAPNTPTAQAQTFQPDGGNFAAELGFGQISEDYFLSLELYFAYRWLMPRAGCDDPSTDPKGCRTHLSLGLAAPLRLRIIDNAPLQDSAFRTEDWNSLSDYFRIIRYLEYGLQHEPIFLRIGQLGPAVLGHGTIVNGYFNTITTDHHQLGAQLAVNTTYGGIEAILNNIVDPHLLASRIHIRPAAFKDPFSWWNGFAIAASVVTDLSAPTRLDTNLDNSTSTNLHTQPVVLEHQTTTLLGLDLEFDLAQHKNYTFTPYTDLNHHFTLGTGWHNGLLLGFPLASNDAHLALRLEHRLLSSQYLPDYIGPLYEIDRYQFAGWSNTLPTPKLRTAANPHRQSVHGLFTSATLQLFKSLSIGLAYDDYQGPNNASLRFRVSIDPTPKLQLGLFYYKTNLDQLTDIFNFDGALIITEARALLYGPFYLKAQYNHLWQLQQNGIYSTVHDWNIGAGAGFPL